MYHDRMTDQPPIRVLGIGNVLTSDDGLGPTVVRILESKYRFPPHVEVIDVGTPGLDFTPYMVNAGAVIVIDAVRAKEEPGSIRIWRDEALFSAPPVARTNPHEPGLREALMATELTDSSPGEVILIGVVPQSIDVGTKLSPVVAAAVSEVEALVLKELDRLEASPEPLSQPTDPDLWWI